MPNPFIARVLADSDRDDDRVVCEGCVFFQTGILTQCFVDTKPVDRQEDDLACDRYMPLRVTGMDKNIMVQIATGMVVMGMRDEDDG